MPLTFGTCYKIPVDQSDGYRTGKMRLPSDQSVLQDGPEISCGGAGDTILLVVVQYFLCKHLLVDRWVEMQHVNVPTRFNQLA